VHLHYIPAIEGKSFSQLSHSFLSTIHAVFSGYDLCLYVNTANGPFGYLTKLFGLKSAINVDGLEWLRPKWKGLGSKYFYWASKTATKAFDVLIADSVEMGKIYEEMFNVKPEFIAYGANIKEKKNTSKISQFGIEKDDYYLIVGRLIPDNNGELIVKGFFESGSDKKLVIVGDVPYKDEYAQRIKSYACDRVIFTGYVTDGDVLYDLYANSYCYLHGHEFGGTNPTLLKALAYKCAILAIDTVFSREVLLDRKHGVFFKKDEQSVAAQIRLMDRLPLMVQRLKNIAQNRIKENYTWEKIADQYDELFQQMLGGKTVPEIIIYPAKQKAGLLSNNPDLVAGIR
jgi:glycosyltransferase involved in cell wall biosynthesis